MWTWAEGAAERCKGSQVAPRVVDASDRIMMLATSGFWTELLGMAMGTVLVNNPPPRPIVVRCSFSLLQFDDGLHGYTTKRDKRLTLAAATPLLRNDADAAMTDPVLRPLEEKRES